MPRLSAVGISGLQAGEDVKRTWNLDASAQVLHPIAYKPAYEAFLR